MSSNFFSNSRYVVEERSYYYYYEVLDFFYGKKIRESERNYRIIEVEFKVFEELKYEIKKFKNFSEYV